MDHIISQFDVCFHESNLLDVTVIQLQHLQWRITFCTQMIYQKLERLKMRLLNALHLYYVLYSRIVYIFLFICYWQKEVEEITRPILDALEDYSICCQGDLTCRQRWSVVTCLLEIWLVLVRPFYLERVKLVFFSSVLK